MSYDPREKPKAKHRIKNLEDYDLFYFFPIPEPGIIIFDRLPDPHTHGLEIDEIGEFIQIPELPQARAMKFDAFEYARETKIMTFQRKRVCQCPYFEYVWSMPTGERFDFRELRGLD